MDDTVRNFIETLLPEESPEEQNLRDYAAEQRVPSLRRVAAAFLRTVAVACNPARFLEVGTAFGYGA